MSTPDTFGHTSGEGDFFVFPDPPKGTPDDTNTFKHLAVNGNAYLLGEFLGCRETTLVTGRRYVSQVVTSDLRGLHYPDLQVAFDVDPALYDARNAYVASDHGKPLDFVLEIAAPNTGRIHVTDKPVDYASLGIPEYWRFDETGQYHGARLGGDRLVGGQYEPIEIEEFAEGMLRGYSAVLNVYLHWEKGELRFYDPATGQPIPSIASERARADGARAGRLAAEHDIATNRARRLAAEHGLAGLRASRLAAEARVLQLEEQLRRQGAG